METGAWRPRRDHGALRRAGTWISQAQRSTSGDFPLLAIDGLSYRQAGDDLGAWDVEFAGSMVPTTELGTQARQHIDRTPAEVHLRAAFRPRAPEVYSTGTDFENAFSWHLDQSGDTEGYVDLGSTAPRRSFRGRGHRDRSFGARDWTYFNSWVYLAGHTPDVTINFWALQSPDDGWAVAGWVQHAGRPPEVVEHVRLTPGEMLEIGHDRVPAFLAFELTGPSGAVTGTAESARLLPLDFTTRRGRARLDRGVGRYVINGQPGSGQVEYQQRADRPFTRSRWRLEHT